MSHGRSRVWWVLLTLIALALLALGALSLSAAPQSGSLSCANEAVFGEPVSCETDGGSALVWGDGTETAVDQAYAPEAIGSVEVQLVHDDGTVLDTGSVSVIPDLALSCELGEDKPVYELVAGADSGQSWAYAYINSATGEVVSPGDPGYPQGELDDALQWIEVESANETGRCDAHSVAAEALGGKFEITLDSEWTDPISVPFDYIIPWSGQHWAGTQPATLTATVDVDGHVARATTGIYFSGCT